MNKESLEFQQSTLHKEIDLIQSCITRMANNSFLIKGWMIALVTAVLAFGDKFTTAKYLCLILILPVATLWYLDAFFLFTERKYRALYSKVIDERQKGIYHKLYDLNPNRDDLNINTSIKGIMFSKTLWPFYLVPLLIFLIVVLRDYFYLLYIIMLNWRC